jgi:hypothetical protein
LVSEIVGEVEVIDVGPVEVIWKLIIWDFVCSFVVFHKRLSFFKGIFELIGFLGKY